MYDIKFVLLGLSLVFLSCGASTSTSCDEDFCDGNTRVACSNGTEDFRQPCSESPFGDFCQSINSDTFCSQNSSPDSVCSSRPFDELCSDNNTIVECNHGFIVAERRNCTEEGGNCDSSGQSTECVLPTLAIFSGSGVIDVNYSGVSDLSYSVGGISFQATGFGTTVTMTAIPSNGTFFVSWNSSLCSDASTRCVFTMPNEDVEINVDFSN